VSLRVSGGRRLQSPPGTLARPTAARVRQAVINRLAWRLDGCRWLDLCCGSGAMACEALQHGAVVVVGVEQDRRIAAVARTNLTAVAAGRTPSPTVQVVAAEVVHWLSAPAGQGRGRGTPFDLIYVDPPYAAGIYGAIAQAVRQGGWLNPDGVMVWECSSRSIPETPPGWRLESCRRYGSSTALYLEPLQENRKPLHEATEAAVATLASPAQGSESLSGSGCSGWLATSPGRSAAEGAAAAVLIPGSHEQARERDGDQAEDDAAEERFDHGSGPGRDAPCNSSMMEARPRAFPAQP